jgi:hypothetical protein
MSRPMILRCTIYSLGYREIVQFQKSKRTKELEMRGMYVYTI